MANELTAGLARVGLGERNPPTDAQCLAVDFDVTHLGVQGLY